MLLTNHQTFNRLFGVLHYGMEAFEDLGKSGAELLTEMIKVHISGLIRDFTRNADLFVSQYGVSGIVILCTSVVTLTFTYRHMRRAKMKKSHK